MSYRAFKRLLGETSLERKCRFLFGAFILVLITLSFWIFALQAENLAYEQTTTTCRLLVNPILAKHHLPHLRGDKHPEFTGDDLVKAWNQNDNQNPVLGKGQYQYHVMVDSKDADPYERDLFKEFARRDEPQNESERFQSGGRVLVYYGAVRASNRCLTCHREIAEKRGQSAPEENDLMAIVRIQMDNQPIVQAVHVNRAFLISIALVAALFIKAGSWIMIRYVIVKPVKHLKGVSDAIAAGELNVRSEIQTGDEFEDLSHAFNRMLRNLVSMQDRWKKVNTDLDRKVDELAQANLALYESNRLKSDFLATMSHELRTPLNSILGFSEVLLSSNKIDDKQKRWVGNIQSSGEQLLNLINDILDLAKIEAGKMQVRPEQFSIHDICEGLLNMFRPLAEKKNIDVRSQMAPDIPLMWQDVGKFQQILQNLISNAIKFTPEGGRVLVQAEVVGMEMVMTITDTGVGIAPEEQELVFEKFRQSGNPLTRKHAGTGLGLSIVRELTKLLGGEVTLQSELGRGSTFTVRLPLHLSEEPGLEYDLAGEHIDLSKAQKVDVRLYANSPPTSRVTKVDVKEETKVDLPTTEKLNPQEKAPEEKVQTPEEM